jgi:DNA mismatch repair protein MutS
MPRRVVDRANEVLAQLEKSHSGAELMNEPPKKAKSEDYQLSFFQLDDPVLENIREEILKTDINTLTPVEALMKLNDIKKLIGGK